MSRDDFKAWMDKQMAFYRSEGIPFIGYFHYNHNTGCEGGALYRLDSVHGFKVTKADTKRIISNAKKLDRDYSTNVQIYQG